MRGLAVVAVLVYARVLAADPAKPAPPPPVPACSDDAQFDGPTSKNERAPTELIGRTAAEIARQLGAPGCRSPERWRYWTPHGCAYEKTVTTLWFGRDGKVARVAAVHHYTGEECMRIE